MLTFLIFPLHQSVATAKSDYRSRTIYFLVTDRFHDHHPVNARYKDQQFPAATNNKIDCFSSNCSLNSQWRKYWGGDIQSVVQKLPYLKSLGIGAIWLTPLMENVRAYEDGNGWGSAYHGYWVQNYDRVNKHFGEWSATPAQVRLIQC